VTETYDCSRAPDWLRTAVKDGTRWIDSMTTTLANSMRRPAPTRPLNLAGRSSW
jgi:hypothetical protein